MFSCEFCEVFKNTYFAEYLLTVASESVTYWMYTFFSEIHYRKRKSIKWFEDNPWMFQRVIWTCEGRYYKTNYKYQRCKLSKTNACSKNILCLFICSFVFLIFLLTWWFKTYDRIFFMKLIWWIRTRPIFKKFDQTKMFQILQYALSNLLI